MTAQMTALMFGTKKEATDYCKKKNKTARKWKWTTVKAPHGGYMAHQLKGRKLVSINY